MMTSGFDLDAYFARIGYAGPRTAALETLEAIHLRHAVAIAFENLDPFLKRPVRLDERSLMQKLVHGRRGGYCFEQNLLLSHALKSLGFHVTGLAARVLWNAPEGAITARGHMLLLINLEETPYIADVGFGGLTLTGPLRLQRGIEQRTPHEWFRLGGSGESWVMEAQIAGAWRALYRFDLQEQFLVDYEVTNWYLSNHPQSHFVTGLIAARAGLDRRHALRGNELAVHHLDGMTERRVLPTPADIRSALEELFHLELPEGPDVDERLQQLAAQGRTAWS